MATEASIAAASFPLTEREPTEDVAPLGDLANRKGELTEKRLVMTFVPMTSWPTQMNRGQPS
jgi:hypothetical protein